ncbi:hypothetical protein ONS95_004543 [Cadophora gregata]|uniref:uncharacterized protein n=1 Tax=Cadophora gregata TaxID=51156 RepID=UPI0026DD2BAA|nr:uncharacterized protein ONS95_004543 [Cadophora gregata]KAK0105094.1 hypothetical protein ONS96_004497 [Cadophora gregata f. sp. sojae]KAK0106038.1 hypothetical protein ONS95_004543 [Cadophora gregata]
MSTFLENRSPVTLGLLALTSLYTIYHLTLYLITAHRRNLISRKHNCQPIPAYPHKDPIFGLDLFLENSRVIKLGQFLPAVQARYTLLNAHTWSQLFLGERVINTAEPENIKAILATQFKEFELPPRRKVAFHPTFGHGIFTTDGKEWEASRALLRPNFTRSQVGDLETFEGHIGKLIRRIPRGGETVDLQELFFMLTMDSATEFLFGTSSDVLGLGMSGQREKGLKFQEAFTYITERVGLQSRLGKLATLLPDKRMDESIKFVHEYIGPYIRKAVEMRKSGFEEKENTEEGRARYVFLEQLAKQDLGERKTQDELLNILLAGRDTTASLLSYLFYTLARRKDVFEKLKAEVDALGGERPTFEQLKAMKYLQYAMNESELFPLTFPVILTSNVTNVTLSIQYFDFTPSSQPTAEYASPTPPSQSAEAQTINPPSSSRKEHRSITKST